MKKRFLLGPMVAIIAIAIGSWLSLSKEKRVTDARVACGEYVSRNIGPSAHLEASSQWPAKPRNEDTWLVQANYSLRGQYDAAWCQLRLLGSKFGIVRVDSNYDDSRRPP